MNYIRTAALVIAVACWIAVSPPATAVVLTFDDLPGPNLSNVPNGYGGLNWSNMGYLNGATYTPSGSGYVNGTVSGTNVAFNEFAQIAAASDGTFTFDGAYLTGAWNDGLNIEVDGLLGGVPLYSQIVVVNSTAPTWFNFNYAGIDKVTFNSSGGTPHGYSSGSGTHFAMDNFTFNTPEPSSLILAALGLIGLGVYGWRRKR